MMDHAISVCRRIELRRESCRCKRHSHRNHRTACEEWKHRKTSPLHDNHPPHSAVLQLVQREGHTAVKVSTTTSAFDMSRVLYMYIINTVMANTMK